MKKTLIFAFAIMIASSSFAQGRRTIKKKAAPAITTKTVVPKSTISNAPNMEMPLKDVKELKEGFTFETTTLDYGNIENGSDGNRFFKFKNNAKETLIIKNAQGSCGCTTPSVPKDPIPAGGSNEMKVNYDTKRTGPFTKTVTVFIENLDGTSKTQQILTITGTVSAPPAPAEAPNLTPPSMENHDGHGH